MEPEEMLFQPSSKCLRKLCFASPKYNRKKKLGPYSDSFNHDWNPSLLCLLFSVVKNHSVALPAKTQLDASHKEEESV